MITIRTPVLAEAPAIAAAHAQAHWETYEPLFGEAARRLEAGSLELAWRRAFRDHAVIRIAEDRGAIIGVACLSGETLAWLYLRASHRRAGLGKRLLDELKAAARAQGLTRLTLGAHSANLDGAAFWEAQGGRPIGRQWVRSPDGDWEDVVYELAC